MIPDAQELVNRQLPLEAVPQVGLVQHFMSSGSLGQALSMCLPPWEVQSAVGTQMPGVPASPVQGPSRARPRRMELAIVKGVVRKRRSRVLVGEGDMVVVFLEDVVQMSFLKGDLLNNWILFGKRKRH